MHLVLFFDPLFLKVSVDQLFKNLYVPINHQQSTVVRVAVQIFFPFQAKKTWEQKQIIVDIGKGKDESSTPKLRISILGGLQKPYRKEIPKRTVCVFNPLSLVSNGSEIW